MWGIIPAAGIGSRIQPLAFSKELLPVGSRVEDGVERPRAVSEDVVERMVLGGGAGGGGRGGGWGWGGAGGGGGCGGGGGGGGGDEAVLCDLAGQARHRELLRREHRAGEHRVRGAGGGAGVVRRDLPGGAADQ